MHITVKNIEIGAGKPKIVVPIVGKTQAEILASAEDFDIKVLDVVEWRVDFYESVFDTKAVLETLASLRQILKDTPIIFTFRTKKEGGEKEISLSDYIALNTAVAQSGHAEIIDCEIFSGDAAVSELIGNVHEAGAFVIASNHDFHKTPEADEIVSRLLKMQDLGADILKIALMPNSIADVLVVLSATERMQSGLAKKPVVTMSMGGKGVVSRMVGEVFGSALTFGAIGKVSAPGQISATKLGEVLDIIHNSL